MTKHAVAPISFSINFLLFLVSVAIAVALLWAAPPLRSQTAPKNRVVISEENKLRAFEFDPATSKFKQIWESVGTGIEFAPTLVRGFHEPILSDLDRDGKNELIGIDSHGISIFGKTGAYPQYHNFDVEMRHPPPQLLAVDVDRDSVIELIAIDPYTGISVFKPNHDGISKVSETILARGLAWQAHEFADCDNDGIPELITAAQLVNIMKWDAQRGFVEKARFANAANLVDVIRVADADNDGKPEIIASGNSEMLSIHSPRKFFDGITYYPAVYQSECFGPITPKPKSDNYEVWGGSIPESSLKKARTEGKEIVITNNAFTQGLLVGDIDGNGMNEIVVGLTGKQPENILVFETVPSFHSNPWHVKKIFGMPLASSQIPGFVLGDADNDGKPEVIFNSNYVLKFSRETPDKLQCKLLGKITDTSNELTGVAVGVFEPEGADIIPAPRVVFGRVNVTLPQGGKILSGNDYTCWVSLANVWRALTNVEVTLECLEKEVQLEKKSLRIGSLGVGSKWDNQKQPFEFKTDKVDSPTQVHFRISLTADGGFRTASNDQNIFTVNPEIKK